MKIFLLILFLKLWQEIQSSCIVQEEKSSTQQLYSHKCNFFGCKDKYYYPTLYFYATCSYIKSINSGTLTTSQNLKYIRYKYSTIKIIPTGTFSKLKSVSEIYLDNSNIETIQPGAFNGLNTLKKLDLSNNSLKTITRGALNSLTNLEFLDLSFNNIQTIEDNAFHGILSLKILTLTQNNLTHIFHKTFSSLSSLNVIQLDYNHISTIDDNSFDDLTNIKYLYISNSNLKNIPDQLLKRTIKLQDIKLPNNRIQKFDFQDLPSSLTEINLQNNSISVIKNWNKLNCTNNVDLSHNKIFTIEPIGSSEIKLLTLESNELHELGSALFNTSRHLTTLNFAKNFIASIQADTFIGLFNLNSLNLSQNEIQHLRIGSFQNLNSLEILDLSDNKIAELEFGTFGGLKNLKTLRLNENRLKVVLEHTFHVFAKLQVLYLNDNLLERLNASVLNQEVKALRSIWLDHNHWVCSDLVFIKNEFEKNRVTFHPGNLFNVSNVDGVACRHEKVDHQVNQVGETTVEDVTKMSPVYEDFLTTTSATTVELRSYFDEKKDELERTSRYMDELFINSTFYNFFNSKFESLNFFQYFNHDFQKYLDDGFKNSSLYELLNKNLTLYNIGEGNFSSFIDREIKKSKLVSYFDQGFFDSGFFKYFQDDFLNSEFFVELNKSRDCNSNEKEITKNFLHAPEELVDENHKNLDVNSLRNQVTLFMCLIVGLLVVLILICLVAFYKLSMLIKAFDVQLQSKNADLELML